MFNGLPPELVRQIIESSVPSTNYWSTYHDRQTLLRSLCLVCHLFRNIAQPLLFEIVWINDQRKFDALLNTLESKEPEFMIWEAIFEDRFNQHLDAGCLERTLRSCQGLRTLILDLHHGRSQSLSVLQDLHHLVDLSLTGGAYQFPSSFRLDGLTRLSIDYTAIEVGPTLLNPVVLPSLRSLALIRTYDDDEIACLNRSRLADLVPQLEVLLLNSRIIQRGLDYLIPAYSRTLFEFNPPSSDDTIDLLQVAEHLRMPEECHRDEVFAEFVASIANQDRQISLRSVYLNISLRDLPSRQVGLLEAIQKLRRVCMEKGIEVTYEDLEVGFLGEVRPSEEFRRRQREVRRPEATDE